jgi:acetamidase/formamidase
LIEIRRLLSKIENPARNPRPIVRAGRKVLATHAASFRPEALRGEIARERPIIAQGGAVHFVGVGPSVEEATEDAARHAIDFTIANRPIREEAYMLLSIIGELRGRHIAAPGVATRLIVPEEQLRAADLER